MLPWLTTHRIKVTAFVLLALPLLLLVTSAGASVGTTTTAPARWAGGLLGSAQAGLYGVVGSVGTLWGRITGGANADEVEQLRQEVNRLREEKTRLIGVLQENARLREMVGFQSEYPEFELAPARVVGRDISPYFRVIKVQIRSDVPLEPRMPVVSSQGLVGQVHRVYEGYADVILVSDPRSRVDAISQRNRALGLVEGLGHEADYRARLSYLTERDEVRLGDVMVTSGMGGIFPRELLVGTISEVEQSERGLFQDVTIEPAVDFARVTEVFVITNVD